MRTDRDGLFDAGQFCEAGATFGPHLAVLLRPVDRIRLSLPDLEQGRGRNPASTRPGRQSYLADTEEE